MYNTNWKNFHANCNSNRFIPGGLDLYQRLSVSSTDTDPNINGYKKSDYIKVQNPKAKDILQNVIGFWN